LYNEELIKSALLQKKTYESAFVYSVLFRYFKV